LKWSIWKRKKETKFKNEGRYRIYGISSRELICRLCNSKKGKTELKGKKAARVWSESVPQSLMC
jgi:hypothetical protein